MVAVRLQQDHVRHNGNAPSANAETINAQASQALEGSEF